MRRREVIAGLGAATFNPGASRAQSVNRPRPLVAVLVGGSESSSAHYRSSFSQGLAELGYVGDGGTIDLVYRYAGGEASRILETAKEVVLLRPDVIVCSNTAATLAARAETSIAPIVSAVLTEPVRLGLVASYSHPGGNVTGVLSAVESLSGKQLELALEIAPHSRKTGILFNPNNPGNIVYRDETFAAAVKLGTSLVAIEVRSPQELASAFDKLREDQIGITVLLQDIMFLTQRRLIAALALEARMPTMFGFREHVEDGGLISYGTDLRVSFHRVAAFVDKILKGGKPAELPVEFPTKLELVINAKTLKALSLDVPPSLLARADEVIE